jgi:pimeloyl-ACP methyl ester carboxylesterase
VALLTSGCFLIEARRDIARHEQATSLHGEVRSPSNDARPIVVVLFKEIEGTKRAALYSVRFGSGPFQFRISEGTSYLFAIEDENENLTWEDGEPVGWYGGARAKAIAVPPASDIPGLDIDLSRDVPEGTAELRAMVAAGPQGNPNLVAAHAGDLADLDDARFSSENGRKGLWQPVEFLQQFGYGIYFLEPYDPRRIPVLFVHGAGGSPREFGEVIDDLDRKRFQPWIFQYPSGFRLGTAVEILRSSLDDVKAKFRYPRIVIVAHSMGGLVSRALLNDIAKRGDRAYVAGFVSISTPWLGHDLAETGTKQSPVVIPSWIDMIPTSPFLRDLLAEPLPPSIPHYLFFSYEGGRGTDGSVSLASELAPSAQDGAVAVYGFAEDHVSILRSDALVRKLNTVLAATAAAGAGMRR